MIWWLLFLTLGIGLVILRFMGFKSQSYQAVAHLVVGGLFGAVFVTDTVIYENKYFWLAIGMSVAELTAFLLKIDKEKDSSKETSNKGLL